jgi:lysylphosphatidylglycerol synthetase-like protein (DUF2156 family)
MIILTYFITTYELLGGELLIVRYAWEKPDSEDLMPEFMREATDFFKASVLYFGLPMITAALLLRYNKQAFRFLPFYYARTLQALFKSQHGFYLLHLLPALAVRYLFYGVRLRVKEAFVVSVIVDLLAIVLIYPVRSLLNPEILKNVYLYAALCPLLMAFFTLRIDRLRYSGGVVIVIFIGILCWGFCKTSGFF